MKLHLESRKFTCVQGLFVGDLKVTGFKLENIRPRKREDRFAFQSPPYTDTVGIVIPLFAGMCVCMCVSGVRSWPHQLTYGHENFRTCSP